MASDLQKNWYSILGAAPTDDLQELKQKYQKLVLMFHPDKQKPGLSEQEADLHLQRFIEVDQAWKVLSNEDSRRTFDLQLRAHELKQGWPVDACVTLEDMNWDSELPENWTDTKETLLEGMVFNVKYLGMTLVGQPKGEDMAAAAIRRIVTTARASAKKFRKVTLTVSPKGIIITDTDTSDLIENVSIYRISYCTADKTQDKVFAYVSQSQFNETLECHAFLCQKKKIAQAVTLTVAQAFKVALDLWEIAQEDKTKKARTCCSVSDPHLETKPHCDSEAEKAQVLMEHKLRKPFLSTSIHSPSPRNNSARRRPVKDDSWDVEDGLDDAFPSNMEVEEMDTVRLAESRSRKVS